MNVSIIVATYGSEEWRIMGDGTAEHAQREAKVERVHLSDGTLAEARNLGAHEVKSDWLVFLDADDRLEEGYIWAMHDALEEAVNITETPAITAPILLVPKVQYVRGSRRDVARFPKPPEGGIKNGNWMVIGTAIQRELFWQVGGFEEWPMYEDWALFARAMKAGAVEVQVPNATYLAYRRSRSRNHEGGRNAKVAAHDAIRRAVFPELYEEEEVT